MTQYKALLTGALMISVGAAFAAPRVDVIGGAAKAGQDATVTYVLHPDGATVTGVQFSLDVATADNGNVDLPASPSGTVPAGWAPPTIAQDSTVAAPLKRFNFVATTSDGGPVTGETFTFTIKLTQKGVGLAGAKLTLVGYDEANLVGSNFSDGDYNTIGLPTTTAGIVNGASRNLGGVMNNTVSVAPGVVAAAAGTQLYLLDSTSDTLADKAGWEGGKPIGGTVTGRPAFGAIGGSLAVAVGADNGDVSVFDVASGNALGKLSGAFTGVGVAPAIDANGNIFVAGTVGGGISVASVGVAGGTATAKNSTPVAGATAATSSPAVVNGVLILGTDQGVFRATVDGAGVITPQVTSGIASAISTSPVVNGGDAFVANAAGTVYKINVATGAVQPSSATLPGPVSNPFAQGDHVLFGGADGQVHSVKTADLTDTATAFADGSLITPVDTGSVVYAGSVSGTVGVVGGATVNVGGPLGSAINVLPAAHQLVVNTTSGTVFAVPTQG